MKKYQNLHTHTSYCDGKLTAEEMTLAAIEHGGGSIGFSEHSYVFFEEQKYSMMPAVTPQYISEVNALRKKYASDNSQSPQIEVFLGMEQDYFTDNKDIPGGLDFVIGSVHHVEHEGRYITIDSSFESLKKKKDEYFRGNIYALVEKYYATIADIAVKTKPDIIGHFDIISKSNAGGKLFDEKHPRYVKAALAAMDKILERCKIFEINSGAMYRKGNAVPYPSEFLLRELKRRGGEIVLSSDSHDAGSLYYKFDEMRELAKSCGFTHIKRLTKDGFIDELL